MLKPAVLYKEELERKFAECLYSEEYFLYAGYATCNELPKIEAKDNSYQWAAVDGEGVVGYFAYQIQPETDTALNFGLYSFDKGNPVVGLDVYGKMKELILGHRRIEWRMIGGNPAKTAYDKLCGRYGGNCVRLHQVTRDAAGVWRDEYIYEIWRGGESGMVRGKNGNQGRD